MKQNQLFLRVNPPILPSEKARILARLVVLFSRMHLALSDPHCFFPKDLSTLENGIKVSGINSPVTRMATSSPRSLIFFCFLEVLRNFFQVLDDSVDFTIRILPFLLLFLGFFRTVLFFRSPSFWRSESLVLFFKEDSSASHCSPSS